MQMHVSRTSRLRRATHIARIFASFGFASAVTVLGLKRFLPRRTGEALPGTGDTEMAVRLRMALEEVGPSAVKLGQIASSRSDILPIEYIRELRKLTDEVAPFPFDEAKSIVEYELGGKLADHFSEFRERPAASASISQVHYARLHDGREVAVKVRRPGIEETMEVDLQLFVWVAHQAERYTQWGKQGGVAQLAEEVAFRLRNELNFSIEGHNTDLLRESLAEETRAQVPRVHWQLSTSKVLVLEWLEGAKATDSEGLQKLHIDSGAAARNLAQLVLKQIFENGYFHADPHSGNLLFGAGERIMFLDCANMGYIGTDLRRQLLAMLQAMLEADARETSNRILMIGAPSRNTDMQKLYLDIQTVLGRYGKMRSMDVGLREVLDHVMHVIFHNQIRMAPGFATIIKTLVMMEGICLQLDPNFDLVKVTQAIGQELLEESQDIFRILERWWQMGQDFQRYLAILPRRFDQLLTKLEVGGITVRAEYDDVERPMRMLATIMDRLAVSILVGAIILASAQILTGGGLHRIGSIGDVLIYSVLAIGVVLGGWLVLSIIKSGRM
jgi:ubiquinone biosynthesis protein